MAAPTLKFKYEISIDASTFIVTDLTGAYNASSNPTGWGSPNFLLSQTALFAFVKRKAIAGDAFFSTQVSEFAYNPAAVSTDQTQISFIYGNDGVLEVTMGLLKVSTDGINYLSGGAIPQNDFFYWNHNGKFAYQMIGGIGGVGTATAVADPHTLLTETTVVQTLMTDILEPKLAIQKQLLYKRWRNKRALEDDDAEPTFQELLKLGQDIQGSIYAFYSGLTTEAQDQVETMLSTYDLE